MNIHSWHKTLELHKAEFHCNVLDIPIDVDRWLVANIWCRQNILFLVDFLKLSNVKEDGVACKVERITTNVCMHTRDDFITVAQIYLDTSIWGRSSPTPFSSQLVPKPPNPCHSMFEQALEPFLISIRVRLMCSTHQTGLDQQRINILLTSHAWHFQPSLFAWLTMISIVTRCGLCMYLWVIRLIILSTARTTSLYDRMGSHHNCKSINSWSHI